MSLVSVLIAVAQWAAEEDDRGAFDPGISPNETAIPGIPALKDLVGGVLSFALFASIAAVIVAFMLWAWGRMSGSPHRVDTGKSAAGWALLAFIGFGMVNTVTKWAWGIGQGIPLPGSG